MTTDERISQDLAIVGRASRERPTALDVTLRKVGALRDAPRHSAATSTATDGLLLVKLARVYARRVAWTWGGIASIGLLMFLLVYFAVPSFRPDGLPNLFVVLVIDNVADLTNSSKLWTGAVLLLCIVGASAVARRVALRRFETRIAAAADPIAAGRDLVSGADARSLASTIAGASGFLLFFGIMTLTQGLDAFSRFSGRFHGPQDDVNIWMLALTDVAISASVAGGFIVGRLRRGYPPKLIPGGILITLVTLTVGLRYDGGVAIAEMAYEVPSMLLRSGLTVAASLGVVLFVTGIALHLRNRELAELG